MGAGQREEMARRDWEESKEGNCSWDVKTKIKIKQSYTSEILPCLLRKQERRLLQKMKWSYLRVPMGLS